MSAPLNLNPYTANGERLIPATKCIRFILHWNPLGGCGVRRDLHQHCTDDRTIYLIDPPSEAGDLRCLGVDQLAGPADPQRLAVGSGAQKRREQRMTDHLDVPSVALLVGRFVGNDRNARRLGAFEHRLERFGVVRDDRYDLHFLCY
jgi:hypothetical protein